MAFKKRSHKAGTAGLEFALSTVFWVPLLLGTSVFGFNLIRAIQVTQIARDVAHMHAYGLDFSDVNNKAIAIRLARGLDITTTGGNGVIIISTLMSIGAAQCTAAGLAADATNCPNINQLVFIRRIVIGNAALRASDFGTPSPAIIDGQGHIVAPNYLTNTSARATGFSGLMAMAAGQVAYVAEAYFASPELGWAEYSSPGHYARSIF